MLNHFDIDVAITLRNRAFNKVQKDNHEITLTLFPNFIYNLKKQADENHLRVNLLVSDWNSTDINVNEIAAKFASQFFHITPIQINQDRFSRGEGLNYCLERAQSEIVFFTDSDMLIGPTTFKKIMDTVKSRIAFNPMCFLVDNYDFWIDGKVRYGRIAKGFGNIALHKSDLINVKFDNIPQHGWEDYFFAKKIMDAGVTIYSSFAEDFIHMWHPHDDDFRNKYSKLSAEEIEKNFMNYSRIFNFVAWHHKLKRGNDLSRLEINLEPFQIIKTQREFISIVNESCAFAQ